MAKRKIKNQGQSLIEVLIGASVAVLLLGGALALINVSVQTSAKNRALQSAWFMNQENMAVASVFAEASWLTAYQLANIGYFSTNIRTFSECNSCLANPGTCTDCVEGAEGDTGICVTEENTCAFTIEPCEGSSFTEQQVNRFFDVTLDGFKYYTCYKVDKVYRDANDAFVTTGGTLDPSTLRIETKVRWGNLAQFETSPLVAYFTRHGSEVFHQTDWSGGSGQSGIWHAKSAFDTAANVTTSVPGQITVGQ